jgi:hypothetical protein
MHCWIFSSAHSEACCHLIRTEKHCLYKSKSPAFLICISQWIPPLNLPHTITARTMGIATAGSIYLGVATQETVVDHRSVKLANTDDATLPRRVSNFHGRPLLQNCNGLEAPYICSRIAMDWIHHTCVEPPQTQTSISRCRTTRPQC